jgi:UDP-GlcNAc3NAcA epimerase
LTLTGSLLAAKLPIPIIHAEAGFRSFNPRVPEEINRVLTDHLSDLLFCPMPTAFENLADQGLIKGIHLVGDVKADALIYNQRIK